MSALILIILLAAAALYASPQLRETVGSLVSEKLGRGGPGSNEPASSGPQTGTGGPGSGATTGTTALGETRSSPAQEGSGSGASGLSLEASASKIRYDSVMEKFNLTINITNTGTGPVTIEEVAVAGYSTSNILEATPALPLALAPGESVSLEVETWASMAALDLYADYPVVIVTSHGNFTISSETVRAPGWQSGYWNDDFLAILTDKVFLELGMPEPYEHHLKIYTGDTGYGVATTYELTYNITGNILAKVNTTMLLQALEDFMHHNNMSNLTIDSARANETYLHINASLADSESYKHAEVTIVYLEDQGITQIITSTTEA